MHKKWLSAAIGVVALTAMPGLSNAQTTGSKAPLGSKQNPIKPTSVSSVPNSGKSTKGKRGSKTNPISGSTHPRGSK
jgi:hypothetical protein